MLEIELVFLHVVQDVQGRLPFFWPVGKAALHHIDPLLLLQIVAHHIEFVVDGVLAGPEVPALGYFVESIAIEMLEESHSAAPNIDLLIIPLPELHFWGHEESTSTVGFGFVALEIGNT